MFSCGSSGEKSILCRIPCGWWKSAANADPERVVFFRFLCVSGLTVCSYGDFWDLTGGQQSVVNRQFLQILQGNADSHPEEFGVCWRNATEAGVFGRCGVGLPEVFMGYCGGVAGDQKRNC